MEATDDPLSARCKCCGEIALWFGAADFNKSGVDRHGKVFAPLGRPVSYYRCETCGFLFSLFMDDWTPARFRREIYNDDYIKVDPDITGLRAAAVAPFVDELCGAAKATLRVYDYGGGTGQLEAALRARGFGRIEGGDPFFDARAVEPHDVDLMLCVEVVEHLTVPDAMFAAAARGLAAAGLLYFTTVLQPDEILSLRTGWWYCAPRNGHVSLHSARSLRVLADRHGFRLASFQGLAHFAWRGAPAWAAHLLPRLAAAAVT